jgi:uncharacterized protein YjbI with pentapeptide repeats
MLVARNQHRVSRRTAVTEAFAKAVAQLGDADSLALQLGGIYALDRVVDDDPTEARRVAEILSAFIRERARSEAITKDVAAAVLVLVRREWPGRVDLSGVVLAGMDLSSARFSHAQLKDANLHGINARGAVFRGADLRDANLRSAILADADLRDAQLDGAMLSGAIANSKTRWPDGFVSANHGVRVA